jgi:hypothetical protein
MNSGPAFNTGTYPNTMNALLGNVKVTVGKYPVGQFSPFGKEIVGTVRKL